MQVRISGYAVSGGGRGIERVDVSIDGGKTWMEATRFQKTGIPYVAADGISNDKWAWVLFELTVDIPQSTEIIAKAVHRLSLFPSHFHPFSQWLQLLHPVALSLC